MSIVDRVFHPLADRFATRSGHKFEAAPTLPRRPLPDPDSTSASTPELSGNAGQPTSLPPRLVGAGTLHRHTATNCMWPDDPQHECTNSYGDPIHLHQACYPSARLESLNHFINRHPSFGNLAEGLG